MKRTLIAAALSLAAAFSLHASDRTWTGKVDDKLSTPGNWNPSVAPVSGDALYFTLKDNTTIVNDLPASTHIFSIHVTSGTPISTLHITGNPWTGGFANAYSSNFSFDSGIDIAPGGTAVIDSSGVVNIPSLSVPGGTSIQLNGTTVVGSLSGSGQVRFGYTTLLSSSFTGAIDLYGGIINTTVAGATITTHNNSVLRGSGTFNNVSMLGRVDPGPDSCNFWFGICGTFQSTYANTIGTMTFNNFSIGGQYAETVIDVNASLSDVISANSVTLGGTLTVFNPSPAPPGTVLKIIDNKGASPIFNTFTGLPEGAHVAANGGKTEFVISYHGGDGNDVTLTERGHSTLTVNATDIAPPASRVPVKAHVSWDGPAPNPPGSVSFAINGVPGPTLPLDAQGNAAFDYDVAAGINALKATYVATGLYDGSTVDTAIFGGVRTPTINTARPDPVPYATPFTMTITLAGSSNPTGVLTITEGAAIVATTNVTGESVSVAMPALTPGTHTLTLTYSGDYAHTPAAGTTTVRVSNAATGLAYAQANNANLTLDLTVPDNSTGPWPVIFAIETDDWSTLPKASTVASRELLRGWAVVTARYRTEFPAQIRDLKAALRWLRANATRFNLQPNRIVAWGIGPAGGHLASLLGTSNGVAGLDDTSEGVTEGSSRVQGVVDWSGADDLASFGSCGSATRSSATALGSAAAPAQYASSDDPPFLLMHGASDCTVASAAPTALANALHAAGVDVSLQVLAGLAGNGSGWDLSAIGKIVDDFLDLKTKPVTSRRRAVRP